MIYQTTRELGTLLKKDQLIYPDENGAHFYFIITTTYQHREKKSIGKEINISIGKLFKI